MSGKNSSFPFMVFYEAFDLPDGRNRIDLLNDSGTPSDDKSAIRRDFKHSLETVERIAERNTQRGRHVEDHRRRDKVMADLGRDMCGKPKRGEPQRLAERHGISVRQVRKWIEQLRNRAAVSSSTSCCQWETTDWQTTYYGEMLREQSRVAGRYPKKRKGYR